MLSSRRQGGTCCLLYEGTVEAAGLGQIDLHCFPDFSEVMTLFWGLWGDTPQAMINFGGQSRFVATEFGEKTLVDLGILLGVFFP